MSARDAAIRAVEQHPSTTFMAPCESLADAVLAAAAPLLRAEALVEGAVELERIADETEARVAECYGTGSGIGPGSAELVREAARTLRSLAGEKATASAAKATPELLPEADVVAWLTKKARELRAAGGVMRAAQADAVAALASKVARGAVRPDNLQMLPETDTTDPLIVSQFDVAMEPEPDDEPVLIIGGVSSDGLPVAMFFDEETRAKVGGWLAPAPARSSRERRLEQLLDTIRTHGGRWSKSRVLDVRRRQGHPALRGVARHDLAELCRRGHLVEHGPADGRFYTLARRADR